MAAKGEKITYEPKAGVTVRTGDLEGGRLVIGEGSSYTTDNPIMQRHLNEIPSLKSSKAEKPKADEKKGGDS
jgi:hypothetical protein